MNRSRVIRLWLTVAALLVLPSLALAEVSVQLDARGKYVRTWVLTAGNGRSALVWRQLRPHLPPQVVLNPLGDTYADGPPAIAYSALTGYPFVVWPKNFGNLRQLAFSQWDGRRWTEPALVHPGLALIHEDREPALVLDAAGNPLMVWTRAEQTAKIYFSTMIQGRWSPGVLISDPGVDSRNPVITLKGTTAVIAYRTSAGPITRTYETAILVDSAASLMDNPIPPLNSPPPGGDIPTGAGNDFVHRR